MAECLGDPTLMLLQARKGLYGLTITTSGFSFRYTQGEEGRIVSDR
jgi:hypothetical protein